MRTGVGQRGSEKVQKKYFQTKASRLNRSLQGMKERKDGRKNSHVRTAWNRRSGVLNMA